MVTRNHWVRIYVIFLKVLAWVIFIGGFATGLAAGIHAWGRAPDLTAGAISFGKRVVAGTAAASVATAPMYLIAYAFDLALQIEENTRRTMQEVDRMMRHLERRDADL